MKVSHIVMTAAALGASVGAPVLAASATQNTGLPVSIQKDNRFLILSNAGIARAFPNAATRPDAVFMTRDRKVSVSLEYRSSTLRPNEVTALLTQYPPVLRRQLPGIKSLNADIVRSGGNQWAQFVMTLPGQNGDRRLEQRLTSVQGRPLVVTIDGSAAGYKANETAVRNLVNSIQVIR
ncbi:hypothetical protein [Deinococcus sp. Marseille-Q6407]|uniref:hypothetical protein n=1 Tax=Deinococcus sp. Marseille-Q6407 TaxID=2969223 RepID=UPI0021C12D74|nr:hypothetical protein [Deinococcus sp. Marseille-Q6407]